MGGPKGYQRGKKTHHADVKINRGEAEEPKPEKPTNGEDELSRREEQALDEHPTGRFTAHGHRGGPDLNLHK